MSLTSCLKKGEGRLDPEDAALIEKIAEEYRADGMKSSEAAMRAVEEAIEVAKAERNQLLQAIKDAGGAVDDLLAATPAGRARLLVSLKESFRLANSRHFPNNREMKVDLQARAKDALASVNLDGETWSQELEDFLVEVAVADAHYALKDNKNAIGWYDDNVSEALSVLQLIHPELATDPTADLAFKWALAVTSNGLKVDKNFQLAEVAYSGFKATGKMPTDVGIGTAASQINDGLGLFNEMLERFGAENLRQFMVTEFTVADLEKLTGYKVSGEYADAKVNGAAILGAKIGNGFYSNLNGMFDKLTIDRWLMRTWGRWTGTLITERTEMVEEKSAEVKALISKLSPKALEEFSELVGVSLSTVDPEQAAAAIKKASMLPANRAVMNRTKTGELLRKAGNNLAGYIDGQKEIPDNVDRPRIRAVLQRTLDSLRSEHPTMTMADLQALLWYPEKRLYDMSKSKSDAADNRSYNDEEAPNYANAAAKLAVSKGFAKKEVTHAASQRGQTNRPGGLEGRDRRDFVRQQVLNRFLRERAAKRGADRGRDGATSGAYKGTGGRGPAGLRGLVAQEYSPGVRTRNILAAPGLPAPKFFELTATPESASHFQQRIQEAKDSLGAAGAAVDVYDSYEIPGIRLFLTENEQAGFAIKPDGDLVSVFNHNENPQRGVVPSILVLATEQGARKLDAYDTVLPRIYSEFGFQAVARTPWNDEYAPPGWDKTDERIARYNNGEPDVVFMVFNPEAGVYRAGDGRRVDEYDQGVALQAAAMQDVPMFSRDTGRGRMTVERATETVNKVAEGLSLDSSLAFSVVADESQLPDTIVQQALREGATGQIRAAYHQGTVYIVANKFARPVEIEAALLHEAAGHYGLRKLLGKHLGPALVRLHKQLGGEAGIRALAEKYGVKMNAYFRTAKEQNWSDEQKAVYLVDELLAHLQGARAYMSLPDRIKQALREFFGAFRNWLRAHNLMELARVTDADLAYLMRRMRDVIGEKGPRARVITEARAAASTETEVPVYYSELQSQIRGLKQASAPAAQWKGIINGLSQKGVKQEEVEWTGLNEWLDEQGGKVERDDILRYLAEHQVVIEEVMAGGSAYVEGEDVLGEAYANVMTEGTDRVEHDPTTDEFVFYNPDGEEFHRARGGLLRTWLPTIAENRDDVWLYWNEYSQSLSDTELSEILESEKANLPTKYHTYKAVKGGENYRELLLKMPHQAVDIATDKTRAMEALIMGDAVFAPVGTDGSEVLLYSNGVGETNIDTYPDDTRFTVRRKTTLYHSSHWEGQPNVLAHIRFDTRTNDKGEKVLLIQEIQSDWHQDGRKSGYGRRTETVYRVLASDLETRLLGEGRFDTLEEAERAAASTREEHPDWEVVVDSQERVVAVGVPDAPFKETMTKSGGGWAGLAFKRMIRYAADNGFDRIAWATGEQNAEVYNLRKHVGLIEYEALGDLMYFVRIRNLGGGIIETMRGAKATDIEEMLGKDIAQQIVNGEGKPNPEDPGGKYLEAEDLKLGGEGMIGFYDKILPRNIEKFVKKWGSKVEGTVIPANDTQSVLRRADGTAVKETAEVWSVPVTEQMRRSAQEGLPMFQKVLVPPEPELQTEPQTPEPQLPPMFSRVPEEFEDTTDEQVVETFETPEELSRIDRLKTALLDKYTALVNTQKKMGDLEEGQDTNLAVTLYPGRTRARMDEFSENDARPLIDAVAASGHSWEDVGKYLHARHAAEANRVLRERNPNRADNESLSGMSNAEAAQVVAQYAQDEKMQLIGQYVDALNEQRLQLMVDGGILSEAQANAWRSMARHYIPLNRDEAGSLLPKRGAGFNVRGKESQTRVGSTKPVDHKHVVARLLMQYEFAINRVEKNKVAQTMYNMAKENPNSRMWTVDELPQSPYLKADGTVGYRPNANAQNVLGVKFNGDTKFVTFSEENEHAQQIMKSLKNIDQPQGNVVTNSLLMLNRVLAAVNTSLSPEFVISNFFRDIQTAHYNLTDTELKNMEKAVIRDVPKALKGLHNAMRGDHTHEWAAEFEEFRNAGGMTGWMQSYEDVGARLGAIKRDIMYRTTPGMKQIRGLFHAIEDYNNVVENGVRLSAYVNARRSGLSQAKAARLAKELTVNFNRKGEYGTLMNAMYLFYNASIQGSARLLRAALNPKNKRLHKMLGATIAFAAMLDVLNRLAGGDDDDGESKYDTIVQRGDADRNLIIMDFWGLGGDKEGVFFKIPLPWGYNIFHILGQEVGAAISAAMGYNPEWNPGDASGRLVGNALQAFNPVQSGTLLQTVAPTFLDPAVMIAENKAWHGGPLMPNYNPNQPNYQKFYSTARKTSREIATWLHEATLDEETLKAGIDWSPAWLDMGWDFFTGSAGRVIADTGGMVRKLATGESWEMKEVPLLRKAVGEAGDSYTSMRFYDRYYEILDIDTALRKMQTERDERYPEAVAGVGDRMKLIPIAKGVKKQLAKIRKKLKVAEESGNTALVEQLNEHKQRLMDTFLKKYHEVMF